ncbi:sigma-70 family RNA polymerase sigma factor [Sphingorhabdus sp.]|uniref:sigma-70 family RNA polymerase sigma factor n=1 Tax=Sphingorhabdus sp. TaxID=1902408 RepID=UPI0035B1124B
MLDQARIESGFRADARAATSSATGLYQFTTQTWLATLKQHGGTHGYGWAAEAIAPAGRGTYIRGAMIDQLRRDARVSRSVMDAQKRIAMARARLEQRQMQLPSDADVAAELGMAPSAFAAYSAAAASVEQSSLDDSYSDHDMGFADPAPLADMLVERAQAQAGLAEAIATLPEREARILQLYFVEELNLHEIGDVLGIGAARVCQIKKAALARLRIRLAQ